MTSRPADQDLIRGAFELAVARYEVQADAAWELAAAPDMDPSEPLAGLAAAAIRDIAVTAGSAVDMAYLAVLESSTSVSLVECLRLALCSLTTEALQNPVGRRRTGGAVS